MTHNILSYLEDSVRKDPTHIAVADANTAWSYEQLREKACRIGTYLKRFVGGKRNQPILVCIDRSAESVAAFYGVVCSGNFYVPVDLNLPEKRLADIYNTTQPAAVLLTKKVQKKVPFPDDLVIEWECALKEEGDGSLIAQTIERGIDTDPLYCIFTSGSTGVPKGVLISHRGVIDMAEQFTKVFGFDETAVFGNQAPFDFDVSTKDLYIALKNGASVEILEKSLFMMPKLLVQRLNERKVNTLIWAAAAMKILSALRTFEKVVPACLRWVLFSGETLPCKVLNDWRAHMPDTRFANVYGPTEITCNCTYYIVDRPYANDESLPIGRAFENSDVFLLCGDQEVTTAGAIGEICVRGTCLALGYYANPAKTEEAFCRNPLQKAYPERIYRTGDLGKWLEDGNLLFLGRRDSQVKYMGHRIELGEIEVAVNSLEQIQYACCLYDEAREKLCLFYQAAEQADKDVLQALRKLLPEWMIPNRVYYLEKMPENRTGKIDRAFLRRNYIEEN